MTLVVRSLAVFLAEDLLELLSAKAINCEQFAALVFFASLFVIALLVTTAWCNISSYSVAYSGAICGTPVARVEDLQESQLR